MKSFFRAHQIIERLAEWAPMRSLLQGRYEKEFAANLKSNLFRGVYQTFDEAQASAPATRPLGYDNTDSAAMYMQRTKRVYAHDYPVIFWLKKLIWGGQNRILDLGGHIGVSYYAYRNYIEYPTDLSWTVHDVPAVMQRGRELALEMDKQGQLGFCDRFEDGLDANILMALGSLQYLSDTLPERLARLKSPPAHLLLNLVPIHLQQSYFTLQSIGTAFCPYRITAMDEFIQGFEALGYKLVDRWENPEKSCPIAFHPEHSLDRYYGFYFNRKPPGLLA